MEAMITNSNTETLILHFDCRGLRGSQNVSYSENFDPSYNLVGARYYDADIALWTSVDPMRQFWSGYSYAGNGYNPINAIDPDGNLVTGVYDYKAGTLSLTDTRTGKSISGDFFSGGFLGSKPLPNGRYELLAQDARAHFYRLDPIDASMRDDIHNATGRDAFRLHHFGRSTGCITACETTDWNMFENFIESTTTEVVWDNFKAHPLSESMAIEKFGEIEVINSPSPTTRSTPHSSGESMQNRCQFGGC